MTEIERIELAIERGMRYDPETGNVYGSRGDVMITKKGYYLRITILVNKKRYRFLGHRFAYYWVYKKLPKMIDHIDRERSNNKIDNLRASTPSENNINQIGKGYYKQGEKYHSQIGVNKGTIYLGLHNTKEEASKAYSKAKEKYHKIKFKYERD